MDWIAYLKLAYKEAAKSPDPSTQNSAFLIDVDAAFDPDQWDYDVDSEIPLHTGIVSTDHNRFPDGVEYKDERWERPGKYKYIEHAERNVIYKAAKAGYSTDGLVMVSPWAACSDCARGIIQSGVSCLVTHKQAHDRSPEFWLKEIEVAFTMFDEAGVEIVMVDEVLDAQPVLHSGDVWTP
jgi:dCMP deaminase